MKVNLDIPMRDPFGNEFQDKSTVRTAAYAAVTAALPEDQQLPADQKLRMYRLTQKIAEGGIVEITAEDISLIKQRAAKALPLVAYGFLCDALEQPLAVVEAMPVEQAAKVG